MAELRNEGYVEEQVRGVIRLTLRGYELHKNKPLPYTYRNLGQARASSAPALSRFVFENR